MVLQLRILLFSIMARKIQQRGEDTKLQWPTILTIRIYQGKISFTPNFTTRPTSSKTKRISCNCFNFPPIWHPKIKHAFPDVAPKISVARFVFFNQRKVARAKRLCDVAQKHCGATLFNKGVYKLLEDLSSICEAQHTGPRLKERDGSANPSIQPFRRERLDAATISEELRAKIMTPLSKSECQDNGMGYVYILRSLFNFTTIAEFKIGFSKYHPENRAHELAGCLTQPEVIAHTPLLPHAKRIESIIHAELAAFRKIQHCGQCGRSHREWFTISHPHAREVVLRWSKWMLERPYREGELHVPWRTYLERISFQSISPETPISTVWADIIKSFPRHDSTCVPEQQLGIYLNSCYFNELLKRTTGLPIGSFEGLMRAYHEARCAMGASHSQSMISAKVSTLMTQIPMETPALKIEEVCQALPAENCDLILRRRRKRGTCLRLLGLSRQVHYLSLTQTWASLSRH